MALDPEHTVIYQEIDSVFLEFLYHAYFEPMVENRFEMDEEFDKALNLAHKFVDRRLNELPGAIASRGVMKWLKMHVESFFETVPRFLRELSGFMDEEKKKEFLSSWPQEIQEQMKLVQERFQNIPYLVEIIKDCVIFLMLLEKNRISQLYEIKTWDFFLGKFFDTTELSLFEDVLSLINLGYQRNPTDIKEYFNDLTKKVQQFEEFEDRLIYDKISEYIEDKFEYWEKEFNQFIDEKLEEWEDGNKNAYNFGVILARFAYDYFEGLLKIYQFEETSQEFVGEDFRIEAERIIKHIHEDVQVLRTLEPYMIKLFEHAGITKDKIPQSISFFIEWLEEWVIPMDKSPDQPNLDHGVYRVSYGSMEKFYTLSDLEKIRYIMVFIINRLGQLVLHQQFGNGLVSNLLKAEGSVKGQKKLLQKISNAQPPD
jgi:hypothetical protein